MSPKGLLPNAQLPLTTPLLTAVSEGNREMVAFLLKHTRCTAVASEDGEVHDSPLAVALELAVSATSLKKSSNFVEIARMLVVDGNCDVTAGGQTGEATPLELALELIGAETMEESAETPTGDVDGLDLSREVFRENRDLPDDQFSGHAVSMLRNVDGGDNQEGSDAPSLRAEDGSWFDSDADESEQEASLELRTDPWKAAILELVQLLLERGALHNGLSSTEAGNALAAVLLAPKISLPALGLLLRHGVNPNIAIPGVGAFMEPIHPLAIAVLTGAHADERNVITVRMLLRAGADPKAREANGMTALMLATERESIAFHHFLSQADIPDHGRHFHELITVLVRAGGGINDHIHGNSALMIAVHHRAPFHVYDTLIRMRANPNQSNQDQWTPIQWLVSAGNPTADILRLLVEEGGAMEDARDPFGHNLAVAYIHRNGRVTRMDMEEDVTDVLQYLVEDLQLRPFQGSNESGSMLYGAMVRGLPAMAVEFLKSIGETTGLPRFHEAVVMGKTEEIRLALRNGHGIFVNVPNNFGVCAIHYASLMHRTEIVELLVEHGAQVDTPTNSGMTPLGLTLLGAVLHAGDPLQTAQVLVEQGGAEIRAANVRGRTILEFSRGISEQSRSLIEPVAAYLESRLRTIVTQPMSSEEEREIARILLENEDCAICLRSIDQYDTEDGAALVDCKRHVYHSSCIQRWASMATGTGGAPLQASCPMCRAPISTMFHVAGRNPNQQ